mgnify:CR=1 FL=1
MGLFDFFKDMGEKIFGREDEAAEKIKEIDYQVVFTSSDETLEQGGCYTSAPDFEKSNITAPFFPGIYRVSGEVTCHLWRRGFVRFTITPGLVRVH